MKKLNQIPNSFSILLITPKNQNQRGGIKRTNDYSKNMTTTENPEFDYFPNLIRLRMLVKLIIDT